MRTQRGFSSALSVSPQGPERRRFPVCARGARRPWAGAVPPAAVPLAGAGAGNGSRRLVRRLQDCGGVRRRSTLSAAAIQRGLRNEWRPAVPWSPASQRRSPSSCWRPASSSRAASTIRIQRVTRCACASSSLKRALAWPPRHRFTASVSAGITRAHESSCRGAQSGVWKRERPQLLCAGVGRARCHRRFHVRLAADLRTDARMADADVGRSAGGGAARRMCRYS